MRRVIVATVAAVALSVQTGIVAGVNDRGWTEPLLRANIDATSLELHGGDAAIFDPIGNHTYDDRPAGEAKPWPGGPCLVDKRGFSASDDAGLDLSGDGALGGLPDQTDAFDGGLFVEVNGKIFNAKRGALRDQSLSVRDTVSGFVVTRTIQALPSEPALREYTTVFNPGTRTRSATVTFDSGMGSDDAEATRASSTGNERFTEADRWFVTSDDPTTPEDVVVTFVLSGRRAPGISNVVYAPEDDTTEICEGAVAYRYRLTVPAGSTVALLTFTELSADHAAAVAGVAKYEPRRLSSELLDGLSPADRNRVANWNLG